MVEQALTVRRESPERPLTGAVFQGQGEPFQNYDNVIQAARVLREPSGLRIGSDRITISTVGLLPQIERYTEEGHPYRLILSLTSAFSEKRELLVPLTARYGVPELAAAMRRHAAARGGPVHLAWVLIAGFNTGRGGGGRARPALPRGAGAGLRDRRERPGQAPSRRAGRRGARPLPLGALAEHGLGLRPPLLRRPRHRRGVRDARLARRAGARSTSRPPRRAAVSARVLPADGPRGDRRGGGRPPAGRRRGLPHRDGLRPRRRRLQRARGRPRVRGEGPALLRPADRPPRGRGRALPRVAATDDPRVRRPRRPLLAGPAHARPAPAPRGARPRHLRPRHRRRARPRPPRRARAARRRRDAGRRAEREPVRLRQPDDGRARGRAPRPRGGPRPRRRPLPRRRRVHDPVAGRRRRR